MKVVLDTNVLISGIFFSGPPARILAEWAGGGVGERLHKQFPAIDIDAVLDLVTRETRIVKPKPVPASACDDPDDLKFLACALAGGARVVVTGDRALLRASGFQGLEVVTPRDFVRRHVER
jgi:predicted nucleic acid-binding protein